MGGIRIPRQFDFVLPPLTTQACQTSSPTVEASYGLSDSESDLTACASLTVDIPIPSIGYLLYPKWKAGLRLVC